MLNSLHFLIEIISFYLRWELLNLILQLEKSILRKRKNLLKESLLVISRAVFPSVYWTSTVNSKTSHESQKGQRSEPKPKGVRSRKAPTVGPCTFPAKTSFPFPSVPFSMLSLSAHFPRPHQFLLQCKGLSMWSLLVYITRGPACLGPWQRTDVRSSSLIHWRQRKGKETRWCPGKGSHLGIEGARAKMFLRKPGTFFVFTCVGKFLFCSGSTWCRVEYVYMVTGTLCWYKWFSELGCSFSFLLFMLDKL